MIAISAFEILYELSHQLHKYKLTPVSGPDVAEVFAPNFKAARSMSTDLEFNYKHKHIGDEQIVRILDVLEIYFNDLEAERELQITHSVEFVTTAKKLSGKLKTAVTVKVRLTIIL